MRRALSAIGAALACSAVSVSSGCAGRAVDVEAITSHARLGLRFETLPEGLVVRSVTRGMGAERAGVVPGDLIVAVDGTYIGGEETEARRLMMGEVGSTVVLSIHGPLGGSLDPPVKETHGNILRRPEGACGSCSRLRK